jgi:hypothetical protein
MHAAAGSAKHPTARETLDVRKHCVGGTRTDFRALLTLETL